MTTPIDIDAAEKRLQNAIDFLAAYPEGGCLGRCPQDGHAYRDEMVGSLRLTLSELRDLREKLDEALRAASCCARTRRSQR